MAHARQGVSFDQNVRRQHGVPDPGQAPQSLEAEINAGTVIGGIRHDCALVLLLALRGS